ncbi:MAG: galactokinase [Acidimicrobiales bacterium]|jgi:galactokinase
MSPALDRAIANYASSYGTQPTLVVRAPGRVNIIGEHTDYNDGFVLPMALPFEVVVAAAPRVDGKVFASSEGFEPVEFMVADPVDQGRWSTYVHGTGAMLIEAGYSVAGWQGCLASDIPAGANLSSSAALEIASGLIFVTSANGSIEPSALARVGQRVENDVIGFPSGIMDQLACAASVDGAASLIDCRALSASPVPLPGGVDIIVMDTGTRRKLLDTQYAARRTDCETAAASLGVTALRDATLDQIANLGDDRIYRRARHVIGENTRTLEAAAAMRSNNAVELGRLMNESHASLRDDFDVSGPALDRIVALAQQINGCLGARMTGGGFAGAAVALVQSNSSEAFVAELTKSFVAPDEQPAVAPTMLYTVRPAAGASVITNPNR